jgi:predicted nucleotidyltransferase
MFFKMRDRILELAMNDLVGQHRCHTVILYGSRSRGDWTEESDYDLIGFRDEGEKFRDARVIEGKFLDAFVYPVKGVIENEKDFLRIRKGTVLLEKDGFAGKLLKKLDLIFDEGPKPLPEDELHAIRVWIGKMLSRITKGDLEGNYRRAWLQYDLIESYFALRKKWYLGPKEAFRWLSENDPAAYALFALALKPSAALADIQRLAEKVLAD